MFYIPFLGALALASGTILEKLTLKKKSMNIKLYQTAVFLAIVLAMLPFIYFFWKMDMQALQPINLLIFGIVILFSIIANLFVFYSLKWEKVTNIEPARVLEPLFVILLAVLFSYFLGGGLYDRNLGVIIPALIAGLALIFSHIKKHHLNFNKYFVAAIFGSLFFALELVISRIILGFYSPITFYFLRSSAIFLISLLIFKPKIHKIKLREGSKILITGIIWFVYRIVIYYGYLNYGVIFTTLMIMLGPVLVYVFAYTFLKERLHWKNIVAAAIILGAVLYTLI